MRVVLLGIDDDDRKTIETHTFARKYGIMIKDNCGYMYVEIAMPEDLAFLSAILKCEFVFANNGFQLNGKRYCTLRVLRREADDGEDKDSGDGVLPKE